MVRSVSIQKGIQDAYNVAILEVFSEILGFARLPS
jgi:hypothetical protein